MEASKEVQKFRGAKLFRQRVATSILTGRPIRIDGIREAGEYVGIQEHEANFLRLIDAITNGSKIIINETGTSFRFTPGIIMGGKIKHECNAMRSIGWYLEGVVPLLPFAKKPTFLHLTGITNQDLDMCVDTWRQAVFPMMKYFGMEPGLDLKVKRRGVEPKGGGELLFTCPIVKELTPIDVCEMGLVKRVRGVAFTCKVSPQVGNRLVEAARGLFNKFIPDVFISTDHNTGFESGNSPGFGCSLVAETTSGIVYCAERTAKAGELPEDVGKEVAELLCEEIAAGGCVDSSVQPLALLFMALCPEDVSKIRLGRLTPFSIELLRLIKAMFGIEFKLRVDEANNTVIASCLGSGFKNLSKKVT